MKETSIDWLIDWMSKNQYFIGNDLLEAIKQAKEKHKQEIINTYIDPDDMRGYKVKMTKLQRAELYYKEIFEL